MPEWPRFRFLAVRSVLVARSGLVHPKSPGRMAVQWSRQSSVSADGCRRTSCDTRVAPLDAGGLVRVLSPSVSAKKMRTK